MLIRFRLFSGKVCVTGKWQSCINETSFFVDRNTYVSKIEFRRSDEIRNLYECIIILVLGTILRAPRYSIENKLQDHIM